MKENIFFEKQTPSSRIKASIVSEYFPSYCKIIVKGHMPKQLRFIDLFSGPGYYQDGNASTPILIARHCKNDELLKNKVKLIFNDNTHSATLKQNFAKEFPDGTFKFKPHFGESTVGDNQEIDKFLADNTHEFGKNKYPSVLFIDPFGYKGIETKMLAAFLKNWGNEIFLFLNTKRIQAAIENEKFEDLMQKLFPTTFETLKKERKLKSNVSERLSFIIDNLGQEYQSVLDGKIYYTAFKFEEEDIDTTSHYILHLTKGARGFDLIKTVYNDFANVGTIFDGINTYTFDAKKLDSQTVEMFDTSSENIDKLKNELYSNYRNKQMTASELFDNHQKTGLYCKSHYTEALRRLVEEQKLDSKFTDNINHKKTVLISKYCVLTFK